MPDEVKIAYTQPGDKPMTESKKKPIVIKSQENSLKHLVDKYKKGSPRVIQDPPPNPSHTFGVEKKPKKLFLPN